MLNDELSRNLVSVRAHMSGTTGTADDESAQNVTHAELIRQLDEKDAEVGVCYLDEIDFAIGVCQF